MSAVVTSATPLVTDERLFSLFTWAPFIMVGLCFLAFCWREHGERAVDEDGSEADWAPAPGREDLRRRADRG